MEDAEKYIRNKYGADNHFSVPDGYFDSLADMVMEKLPDEQTNIVKMPVSAWRRRFVAISAAAASIAIAVCLVFKTGAGTSEVQETTVAACPDATSFYDDDSDVDAMAHYTMVDAADMYAYMSDAE